MPADERKIPMRLLKKQSFLIPILILTAFLIAGLCIYNDYGASADEHIQIEGEHILWRELMNKFHLSYPPEFDDLPELGKFQNRYYGYAAMFPVTIYEAIHSFQLDSSRVIAARHLWSFLTYFTGCIFFAILIQRQYRNQYLTAAALLLLILQPRLFGDIFYNDRDLMLISWMLVYLYCFDCLARKNTPVRILLCGFAMAMAINTRIFGIVLMVFPFLSFLFIRTSRKAVFLSVISALIFMFIMYPIAWNDPLRTIPEAASHFLTQQRSLDTGNQARLLFMGEKYYEHEVPRYYLPVYILISTPLTHLVLGTFGGILYLPDLFRKKLSQTKDLISSVMLLILIMTLAAVMILNPTFYNGWRHFYFLSLPILFLAIKGFSFFLNSDRKILFLPACLITAVFAAVNICWIISAHPYQIIYLNPVVRSKALGKFDRDYWLISTPECMKVLDELVPEGVIRVIDIDALIQYAKIGESPEIRERFVPEQWKPTKEPVAFIIYNYTNKTGNERSFPGYKSIYAIERDNMKIAEIYQYDEENIIIPDVDPDGSLIFPEQTVSRIELYDCTVTDTFPPLEFSYLENGNRVNIPAGSDSTNGYKFEYSILTGSIRIETTPESGDFHCGKIFLRQ